MDQDKFAERAPRPGDPIPRFITRCNGCGTEHRDINAEFMHQWQEQHICPTPKEV